MKFDGKTCKYFQTVKRWSKTEARKKKLLKFIVRIIKRQLECVRAKEKERHEERTATKKNKLTDINFSCKEREKKVF